MSTRGDVVQAYIQWREGTSATHERAVTEVVGIYGVARSDVEQFVSSARSAYDTKVTEERKSRVAAAVVAAAEDGNLVVVEPPRDRTWEPEFAMERIWAGTQDDLKTASAPDDGRWEFDKSVAERFDDMLPRSVPGLLEARRIIGSLAEWAVQPQILAQEMPSIMDLGSSTGGSLLATMIHVGEQARYVAVENSAPMLTVLRERFETPDEMLHGFLVEILDHDLREGLPGAGVMDVIQAVLTLQFVPMEHRPRIIADAYKMLCPDGLFVVAEKVVSDCGAGEEIQTALYRERKRQNGYTDDAIARKALALEDVLVPTTAAQHERWLRAAGFRTVELVWAWGPFRAWAARK
jgi:tRNA (cmo5U34)-methyltransferase